MPKKITLENLASLIEKLPLKKDIETITKTLPSKKDIETITKTKIEDLGQMVAKGFETTATKEELKKCATKEDLKQCATKEDLGKLKEKMATGFEKIDKRVAKLRGDLVIIVRKEDKKLSFVINLLKEKKIFSPADLRAITQIRVFPKIKIST